MDFSLAAVHEAIAEAIAAGIASADRDEVRADVEKALALNQDALHPSILVSAETVQAALDANLQVNVGVPDTAESMEAQIDKGSTALITNEPAILADLLDR